MSYYFTPHELIEIKYLKDVKCLTFKEIAWRFDKCKPSDVSAAYKILTRKEQ